VKIKRVFNGGTNTKKTKSGMLGFLFLVHQLCKRLAQKLWEAQYSWVVVLPNKQQKKRESDCLG